MDPRFTDETLAFAQMLLQKAAANTGPPDVGAMRNEMEQLHTKINAKFLENFTGTITEQTIKTSAADIPISIHTPANATGDKLGIFFHGGGWVTGSRKSHKAVANYLADTTKFTWISVDYRLAPEHKFPIWLDDATEATEYILKNKTSYGASPSAKVGVAGDSAGGMIAASIARYIKGLSFQILIYAALDLARKTPSQKEFTEPQYLLTPELVNWFLANAFNGPDDYLNPRASFISNTSCENLVPCLFIVAELDILRDGSIEYQKVLEKAGVKTELVLMRGLIHGFIGLPGIFPNACATAMDAVKRFLAEI